jgi:hypothetical protein
MAGPEAPVLVQDVRHGDVVLTLPLPCAVAATPTLPSRVPAWLLLATGALAFTFLVLAVGETSLWAHYLIDGGESLSLLGLGFILIAGLSLFRQQRLLMSLPLVFPWLLYPVITQGDQIIDNLSINPMRAICDVLLAAIFGAPVAVAVLAARCAFTPKPGQPSVARRWMAWVPGLGALAAGRTREGTGLLAATLLAPELWIAHQFLGTLMVVTLIVMILGAVVYAFGSSNRVHISISRIHGERVAVGVLLLGVAISSALYFGYKNRQITYQGYPSALMDPSQKERPYPLGQIPVPSRMPAMPVEREAVEQAFTGYARTLQRLLVGYHILDRNYTYDFHNHLFLRHTPLMPNYRAAGLQKIEEARRLRADADTLATTARSTLTADDPLAALLDDLQAYVAFNFDRAPILERRSGEFERTAAGLQHAAHLYEGESKGLGRYLADILKKHHSVIDSAATTPVTREFVSISRSVHQAYANHVVGF